MEGFHVFIQVINLSIFLGYRVKSDLISREGKGEQRSSFQWSLDLDYGLLYSKV